MSTQMSNSKYSILRIRFIVNDSQHSTDEWVEVLPSPSNPNATALGQEYTVTSKFGKYEYVSQVRGSDSLLQHIGSILRLVAADDLPCKRVQLDIPHVPSLLINHSNLQARIFEIVNMVHQVTTAWPQLKSTTSLNANAEPFVPPRLTIPSQTFPWDSFRTPSRRTRRHLRFDDDGHEVIDLTMED